MKSLGWQMVDSHGVLSWTRTYLKPRTRNRFRSEAEGFRRAPSCEEHRYFSFLFFRERVPSHQTILFPSSDSGNLVVALLFQFTVPDPELVPILIASVGGTSHVFQSSPIPLIRLSSIFSVYGPRIHTGPRLIVLVGGSRTVPSGSVPTSDCCSCTLLLSWNSCDASFRDQIIGTVRRVWLLAGACFPAC